MSNISVSRADRTLIVKYLPPTNHKGSRMKAVMKYPSGGVFLSVTLPYNYGLNEPYTYDEAARALVAKLKEQKGFENWCVPDECLELVRCMLSSDSYLYGLTRKDWK